MKLLDFLKVKQNRYIIISINVIICIILAFVAVALDEKYGAAAITGIYIIQIVCIISLVIIFSLILYNVWLKTKKKLEKRNQEKGLDK